MKTADYLVTKSQQKYFVVYLEIVTVPNVTKRGATSRGVHHRQIPTCHPPPHQEGLAEQSFPSLLLIIV
jgi:hypothetical protein